MGARERVENYISTNGSITQREAFLNLGVSRLSNIIYEMRKDGVNVVSESEQGINRFGEKTRFSRYYIERR